MAAPIHTRRWIDPSEPSDGTRILVTRYRPRGVAKADETWVEWLPDLGPSVKLHAAAYGKSGLQISWEVYRASYLKEMSSQTPLIDQLATRVANGETITLLCSSQCVRESRCHRSLLRDLIQQRLTSRSNA